MKPYFMILWEPVYDFLMVCIEDAEIRFDFDQQGYRVIDYRKPMAFRKGPWIGWEAGQMEMFSKKEVKYDAVRQRAADKGDQKGQEPH